MPDTHENDNNGQTRHEYERRSSLDENNRANRMNNEVDQVSIKRQSSEPARKRWATMKRMVSHTASFNRIKKKTEVFFGIDDDDDGNKQWDEGRRRFMERRCGPIHKRPTNENQMSELRQSSGGDVTDGYPSANIMSRSAPTSDHDQHPYSYRRDDEIVLDEARRPVYRLSMDAISTLKANVKRSLSSKRDRQSTISAPSDKTKIRMQLNIMSDENQDDENDTFFDDELSQEPTAPFITPSGDTYDGPSAFAYAPPGKQQPWRFDRQHSLDPNKSIPNHLIKLMENSDRRKYGMGIIGRLLNRQLKQDLTKEERKAIDHFDDHRPYFTYWVSFVQFVILIITLCTYGFASYGFDRKLVSALIQVPSLSLQQVDYYEYQNFWWGPRSADLIHLGAKYTPCMRRDPKIYKIIEKERDSERSTGCCIRNDGSGCIQSQRDKCSPILSTWHNWNKDNSGPIQGGVERRSGPVCGQDPRDCAHPASVEPYPWIDDITKWPKCKERSNNTNVGAHTSCELIGRPCCIGVSGQCHITTKSYCDFLRGSFHEEATLCSQVSCMKDVCSMINFWKKDTPDQFYRIIAPIFLHAGLVHYLITLAIQMTLMRDIERLAGPFRVSIIYLLSGIAGYLASAIFVPYRPEVGPAGSQFGILACVFVELINSRSYFRDDKMEFWKQIVKLSCVPAFLFIIGLLPLVDNFAHIFGFFTGILLSLAFLPYIKIKTYDLSRKMQVIFSLIVAVGLFIFLFAFLYINPIDIPFFKFLNCVPLTQNWCANQEIRLTRIDIL